MHLVPNFPPPFSASAPRRQRANSNASKIAAARLPAAPCRTSLAVRFAPLVGLQTRARRFQRRRKAWAAAKEESLPILLACELYQNHFAAIRAGDRDRPASARLWLLAEIPSRRPLSRCRSSRPPPIAMQVDPRRPDCRRA